MLTHFSLFTGIGGIDLASEWAGFTTVGQVEIDDFCNKVLEKRWPDVPRWGDVRDVTRESVSARGIGRIDLLSGGFPCQPHSCAGKRKASADERDLWGEFARVICELEPRWVLAENVRGLLSSESGRFFGRVLRDLADMGYSVGWCCYGANAVGAPHQRERVFIVAHTRGGGFCEQGICLQQQGRAEVVGAGQTLAHSTITQRQPGAEVEGVLRAVSTDQREHDNADGSGEARREHVADTAVMRREGFYQVPRGNGEEQEKRRLPESSGGSIGPAQPRLGRVPHGFSAGMDGHWPAGWWPTPQANKNTPNTTDTGDLVNSDGTPWRMGQKPYDRRTGNPVTTNLADAVRWPSGPSSEQHEWEPPRIAKGVPHRTQRLKALGNAVVPAQVYPILQAIADIEARQEGV